MSELKIRSFKDHMREIVNSEQFQSGLGDKEKKMFAIFFMEKAEQQDALNKLSTKEKEGYETYIGEQCASNDPFMNRAFRPR